MDDTGTITVNRTQPSHYFLAAQAPSRPAQKAAARQTILRRIIYPSWIIFAVLTIIFLLPVQVPFSIQLIPLIMSVIFFGLPHGAADPAVPSLHLKRKLKTRQTVLLLIGYTAFFLVFLGLWWLAPGVGFIFFILMTWWHWGTGELYTLLAFHEASFLSGRFLRILTVLVRGAIPMLVPLIFFPEAYQLAAGSIGSLFGADLAADLSWAFTPSFRLGAGLTLSLLAALLSFLSYRRARDAGSRQTWGVFMAETGMLVLFFAVVPSFAAVGLYFCLWHSLQHIARLALLDETSTQSLAQGQLLNAFGRFARNAAQPTLIAIFALTVLYFLVPWPPNDVVSIVALYLALIAALTLPHMILVTWLDRTQGVWSKRLL